MTFLAAEWRPVTAVLEERLPTPLERATFLWPVAEKLTNQVGFTQQPGLPEIRGFERAWQMATIRWIALRAGSLSYFPKYNLPLRKGSPPSPGKVPFWIVGQERIPLLVDSAWTPDQLLNDTPLPSRLQPYIVDHCGLYAETAPDDLNQAHLEEIPTDASFGRCIREELARLDLRFRR